MSYLAGRRRQANAGSSNRAAMASKSQAAVVDKVNIQLKRESVAKTIERFRRIADKNTLKILTVVASSAFESAADKFIQDNGMETLLMEIAEYESLTEFTMKLRDTTEDFNTVVSVSAENLALFLEAAEDLQHIKLINVPLMGHFEWLEQTLSNHKSLKTLELVKCDLTGLISSSLTEEEESESASLRFFQALSNAPALQKINLNNVQLDPDIPLNLAYCALVQHSHPLEDLTIKNCPALMPSTLMDALQTKPNLKRLWLDPDEENALNNCCLEPLGNMIAASTSLEEIWIRLPADSGDNLMPIVQTLKTNRTLKKLHFLGNQQLQITPQVMAVMEEVLQANFVIELFGSANFGWPDSIDFAFKLNRAGRHLLIEGPTSPPLEWKKVLLKAHTYVDLDCINVIYYFLSKNPAIVQTFVPCLTESPRTKKRRRIT